ncbi:capsular biosynthesis protein [Psychrobacillus sp. INOP01]|uniref:tyrosine-protein phosphatase n=1 Tax=Psychrobacillus sp. INOP01 TaxID=2829187 RepID=UPI001BADB3CD|nr:CpsB/CapC family capsule biosynthesis tyrosine phosphatase [Psychrobacillus sp. INOP01]QUG40584.1 capsular biosynthesis protein [Psychrobacillus sp. INOP01]
MIDIHSHILYGLDDGPSQLEETIQMFEQALKEGITEIVSTSHAFHPQFNASAAIVTEQIELLKQTIEERQMPLKLHIGHEVRLKDNLVELLQENKIHTLAASKYLLLELPSSGIPNYTVDIIHQLLSEDILPIIAHPERNKAIADKPARLEKLINHGAVAQITAGSLAGHFGRGIQKLSLELVDANLVHIYGSDVHNLKKRPFKFDAGLRYLEKHKRLDAVDIFLENNARIVGNQEIIILEPEELGKQKWWNIFA